MKEEEIPDEIRQARDVLAHATGYSLKRLFDYVRLWFDLALSGC
jgi:hypothetical protein